MEKIRILPRKVKKCVMYSEEIILYYGERGKDELD